MGDTLLRATIPGVPHDIDTFTTTTTTRSEEVAPPHTHAHAHAHNHAHYAQQYRPSPADFTPPASPQLQQPQPHAAKKGFGSLRSRHPVHLQMDTQSVPAYNGTAYNPSPAESPTLPPSALPSPKFPHRHRAPSLLRHAAVPSPLYGDHSRPTPFPNSPTMAPAMARQGSGPGSPGLRGFYNPLASNPVNSSGPQWDLAADDLSGAVSPIRPRGLTNSSQQSFQATPPLRSVTSIPDYSQYRRNERTNLSGTYKPNRGVPNWSHTDYYPPPPRPFRGEEPRASVRSAWTTASSSVMEASGTERSSIITARSSIVSERQASMYSRDNSRDRLRDRDESPETILTSEIAEEDEEDLDAVSDVLDSYYYDEDDQDRSQIVTNHGDRGGFSPSPVPNASEPPELSQTPSRDFDSLDSFQSSESLRQWGENPQSHINDGRMEKSQLKSPLTIRVPSSPAYNEADSVSEDVHGDLNSANASTSPTNYVYSPRTVAAAVELPSAQQSRAWQRSDVQRPQRVSVTLDALSLGTPNSTDRVKRGDGNRSSRSQMTDIRRDISGLPQIPTSRTRLSRQDWAAIESYTKRHSKRPSASRTLSTDSGRTHGMQSPPLVKSEPLPELDEDEAIPRRASTSVFDRKSTLFDLGMMAPLATSKSKPIDHFTASPTSQHSNTASTVPPKKLAPVERDRYGFKKASDKIKIQEYNAWASKYEEHINRRRMKWHALMQKQGLSTNEPSKFPEMSDKVKRYARKGYPPEWRGAMWWYYSGGQHMIKQKNNVGLYASLVERVKRDELNKDDKDAIERDLDRTFPDNIHFRPEPATDLLDGESDEEPALIQDLREVLSCFALNNPNIGYCQSLNFIAGLLLLFLKQDKERAFIMLTIITQNHLPGAHARNLANTEVNVLMMLIKDYLPKVWASINDTDIINTGPGSNAHPISKFQRQPTVALSCTSWFMSIFVGVLPIETVLRVWDAFLYEGPRALYRYALAIFKLGESEIRKYQPGDGELYMTVQNLPRTCLDINMLHDLAFVKKGFGNLSQSVIDEKRMFWREQNKMAHQTSVKTTRNKQLTSHDDEDTDRDSLRKVMGMTGLRRKASRKFRRMRT